MANKQSPLPADLPRPVDDGAADHLTGLVMPEVALPSTRGGPVRLDRPPTGHQSLVVFAYPRTARPGQQPPPGWDQIPGARGCTPETCGFRDLSAEFAAAGAVVVGVSTQGTAYQQEAATRLKLPYPLLSDARLTLATALRLPTFDAEVPVEGDPEGRTQTTTLLKRLTLVVRDGVIAKVFYPVFPPDAHPQQVLDWLRSA